MGVVEENLLAGDEDEEMDSRLRKRREGCVQRKDPPLQQRQKELGRARGRAAGQAGDAGGGAGRQRSLTIDKAGPMTT